VIALMLMDCGTQLKMAPSSPTPSWTGSCRTETCYAAGVQTTLQNQLQTLQCFNITNLTSRPLDALLYTGSTPLSNSMFDDPHSPCYFQAGRPHANTRKLLK
jgi:hypothetical protein